MNEVMPYSFTLPAWCSGPTAPACEPSEVHLWQIRLAASPEEIETLRGLLDEAERNRATRFRLDDVRRRYEAGHGRLRTVLARYLNLAPDAIMFHTGEHGKPFLDSAQNPGGLQFSFSHSGEVALLGVAAGRSIGVDVEAYRDAIDYALIARRQFAAKEADQLDGLPADEREAAFYTCWTRKEAYVKARGEGLATGLDRFEVAFLPGDAPRIVWSVEGPDECTRWDVIPVDLGPRAAAACVVEGPIERARCWSYPD